MRTMSKQELIERMAEVNPLDTVEREVEQAVVALGWQAKQAFDGLEIIKLGAKMAELTYAQLSSSANAEDRAVAAEVVPFIESLQQDVLVLES